MKKIRLALFLIVFSAMVCAEDSVTYEFGVFLTGAVEFEDRPDHVAGRESFFESFELVKSTNRVPARKKALFGISYRIPENLVGAGSVVKKTITFPGDGLTNPKTGIKMQKITDSTFYANEEIHDAFLYRLSEGWEVKKGVWVFEVLLNGKPVVTQSFTLH